MLSEPSCVMKSMVVKNLPKGNTKSQFEALLAKFQGKVTTYKPSLEYAFVSIPATQIQKAKKMLEGRSLQLSEAADSKTFFLDTRLSKGSLDILGEEKIKKFFAEKGNVVSLNIKPKKGFGFLVMSGELKPAMYEIEGHFVDVRENENKKEDENIEKFFLDSRLTFGNLDEIAEDKLKAHFEEFGDVVTIDVKDKKGFGFLMMKEAEGLEEGKHEIDGHVIYVKKQDQKAKGRKRKGNWKDGKNSKKAKKAVAQQNDAQEASDVQPEH